MEPLELIVGGVVGAGLSLALDVVEADARIRRRIVRFRSARTNRALAPNQEPFLVGLARALGAWFYLSYRAVVGDWVALALVGIFAAAWRPDGDATIELTSQGLLWLVLAWRLPKLDPDLSGLEDRVMIGFLGAEIGTWMAFALGAAARFAT